jgi:uncharacterized repeat protein (TIGR03803 family)
MQAEDGNFYGTTGGEGASVGYGTVFKMTQKGTLTTLFKFGLLNGAFPEATLVQGADGNLYGTTVYGGLRSYWHRGPHADAKTSSTYSIN